jgi:hypothetical protein
MAFDLFDPCGVGGCPSFSDNRTPFVPVKNQTTIVTSTKRRFEICESTGVIRLFIPSEQSSDKLNII